MFLDLGWDVSVLSHLLFYACVSVLTATKCIEGQSERGKESDIYPQAVVTAFFNLDLWMCSLH